MKSLFSKLSVLLLAAGFAVVGCQDFAEDIRQVEEKIEQSNNTLTQDFTVTTDGLKAEIADLEAQHAADIKAAEEAIAKLKTDLEGKIAADIDAAEAALQAAYEAADKALAAQAANDKKELEGKLADAAANAVKALEDAKAALAEAYKQADQKIETEYKAADIQLKAELEKQLSDLRSALENADAAQKSALEAKIAATEKALSDAKVEINATVAALQTSLSERISKIEGEVAGLRASVDEFIANYQKNYELADTVLKQEIEKQLDALKAEYATGNAELTKKLADLDAAYKAADETLKASIAAEKQAVLDQLAAEKKELLEKIQGLEKTLNDKDLELEESIAALKTDLEAADVTLQANIDAAKATLEEADAKLQEQITENAGLIADLQEADKNLQAAIDALANTHAEDKDALKQLIKAEADARAAALQALTDTHDADVANLQGQINVNVADIAAEKKTREENDAKLQANIDAANEALAAAKTALEEADAELQDAIDAEAELRFDEDEKIRQDLAEETLARVADVAALDGRIDVLEAWKVKAQDAIDANKDAIAQNAEKIELLEAADVALQGNIDAAIEKAENELAAFKQLVADTYATKEELSNAVSDLEQKISDEVTKLNGKISALDTALDNYMKANDERVTTEATARAEADKALNDLIYKVKEGLETAIKEGDAAVLAKLQEAEAALKQGLTDAKNDLQDKIDAEKEAREAAIAEVEESVADLGVQVGNINATVNAHDFTLIYLEYAAFEAQSAIEELAERLGNVEADVDAILNRVQSIVFVPEYTDGKGTINYAMAGKTLIETRSTMVYQVYPAECAALIANTPAIDDVVAPLHFEYEGLKTRGGLDMGPQFNIVGVEGDNDGRLYVTFEPRNLGEEFYAGEKEYAISLVFDSENANLSTVYTNVVPAKAAEEITMSIMYGEEDITNKRYPLSPFDFPYTDTETVEEVLPEHRVVFNVGENTYEGIEALNAAGYSIEMERAQYLTRTTPELHAQLGSRPFTVTENENGIYEVQVTEVDNKLIANPIYVGYTYTVGTLTAEAYSVYSTAPVQADLAFDPVSATWTYSLDATVDANKSGAYSRVLDLTVAEHNLPADVKVENVLASEPTIEVTVNGEEDTEANAKIHYKEGKALLEITNFDWDKEYVVKAKYNVGPDYQPYVVVTATIPFTTVDRNSEPIVINLDPSTVDFEANLQLTNEIFDALDVVYETMVFGNENYDITCDEWLAANLAVGYTYVDALKADGKDITVTDQFNTMLAIDGAESAGKKVYTAFSYADFDFVPAQLEYTKTVTTWYGEVIVLNKVLNFEFPVYDFKHNPHYVYGGENDYYSQVQPEYTWMNDNEAEGLLKFDVAAVDLRAAFSVVDAEGNKLNENEMGALGLKFNFEIEDKDHDGIDIDPATDKLSYYGANESVNVRGNLVIVNDNGSEYVVPTSFDEGGKYESYNVLKFNPIGTAEVIQNPTINVNNSVAYNVHILDYVKLMDRRSSGRQNYALITDGAWVVGNGENGFATGVDVRADYMYRIHEVWTNDYSDVDPDIRPYITLNDATLTFDNTQQLQLTKPFTIPVTLKFQNCWMSKPQMITVKVTFNPINGVNPAVVE